MALSLRLDHARSWIEIEQVYDRDFLAELLWPDRYNAAYALAQLDDDAWLDAEFFTAKSDSGVAVVCHSRGGLGQATTVSGPAEAVRATLPLHPGYAKTFAIASPHHVDAMASVMEFRRITTMLRMVVDRERFRPMRGAAQPMLAAHTDLVNLLYNTEGDPVHYRPDHIGEGCYWGVTDDERLVALAGTHAIGRQHGIAIVGNVFTHSRYRRRGHGTTVTSAVTEALLQDVNEVALSVNHDNLAAIRTYERLGYRPVGDIAEGSAIRVASTLITTLRRGIARRRSPIPGREVVGS